MYLHIHEPNNSPYWLNRFYLITYGCTTSGSWLSGYYCRQFIKLSHQCPGWYRTYYLYSIFIFSYSYPCNNVNHVEYLFPKILVEKDDEQKKTDQSLQAIAVSATAMANSITRAMMWKNSKISSKMLWKSLDTDESCANSRDDKSLIYLDGRNNAIIDHLLILFSLCSNR